MSPQRSCTLERPMTTADRVKVWVGEMDPKAYSGFMTAISLIVVVTVFWLIPSHTLPALNALFSGVIWTACLGLMIFGGNRIDRFYYAAAGLISGGITITVPYIMAGAQPVQFGFSLAVAGVCLFVVRACVDMLTRLRGSL
jgi:drug/metabolite transporter (DMT)-like permease